MPRGPSRRGSLEGIGATSERNVPPEPLPNPPGTRESYAGCSSIGNIILRLPDQDRRTRWSPNLTQRATRPPPRRVAVVEGRSLTAVDGVEVYRSSQPLPRGAADLPAEHPDRRPGPEAGLSRRRGLHLRRVPLPRLVGAHARRVRGPDASPEEPISSPPSTSGRRCSARCSWRWTSPSRRSARRPAASPRPR